jgi:hypothetical protein
MLMGASTGVGRRALGRGATKINTEDRHLESGAHPASRETRVVNAMGSPSRTAGEVQLAELYELNAAAHEAGHEVTREAGSPRVRVPVSDLD